MGQIILERRRDAADDWTPSRTPAGWTRARRLPPGWRRWPVWVAAPLALAVPIAMVSSLLWGIWHWSGAVPLDDEWLWALLLDRAKGGTLTLGDLWAPHNGHRILFPTLTDLALIHLTHWNRQMLMTFNLAVMVAVALLLFWCVWRTTRSAGATLTAMVPLGLLLFSWGSYESWFQPFQLVAFLAVLGLACCMAAWAPRAGRRFPSWVVLGVALGGAVLASFSFAAGLMLWIAFLPSALAAGRRVALIWLAAAASVWAVYFAGFNHPGLLSATQPVGGGAPLRAGALVAYVLAYLGAPLAFPDAGRALALGAAGLALLLVTLVGLAWRRALWPANLIWLELALFALLTAGETAYARLAQGPAEAISSRYQVWSSLWWVALCVLSVQAVRAWWAVGAWGTWGAWSDWGVGLAARLRAGLLRARRDGTRLERHVRQERAARPQIAPLARVRRAGARSVMAGQAAALVAICAAVLAVNGAGMTYTQIFVLPLQWHQDCALRYQESPAGCAQYYTDAGTLAFQTWSALLQSQHNAIFATGAVGRYSPQAAVLPLVRYYNPHDMDHWATTDFFAPAGPDHLAAPTGYRPDALIGYLYDTPQPGTAALYGCLVAAHGYMDYMVSRQADCEGQQQLGVQGWLYTTLPRGIYVKPLYRCLVGLNHFISTQTNCEGFHVEGLLGWVLAAPGG